MSKSQADWDRYYLKVAEVTAELSHDYKTKVGCVIVKGDQILSYSYNGTPPGWSNTMRDDQGKTLPEVIHAEAYAIAKLSRSTSSSEGATLYCTLSPCVECVKIILAAGISRVVYRDNYKSGDGMVMLIKAGIVVDRYYLGRKISKNCECNHSKLADPQWLAKTGL